MIHKRSRLPMTYWRSLVLLPLENGTLGNTQLLCRPYQIKGSLPGTKKKAALFTEFLYFVPDDSLSHFFSFFSVN